MRYGVFMAALAASCLTLLLCAASCKQQPPSSTTIVKPLPKGGQVTVTPGKPALLSSEKAGDDQRYVISYEDQEFHLIAGEKGIFGIKILAPPGTQQWSSLWLEFFPAYPRQRSHEIGDLSAQAATFDYVPESYRSRVVKARELANHVAPQRPQVGKAANSPRAANLKLKGLDLPPIAANELAIFGHTANLSVIVKQPLPARPLPANIKDIGELRFTGGVSEEGYTPEASWTRMKMSIKYYDVGLMAIKQRSGAIDCYLEFYKPRDNYKDLTVLLKFGGGMINITRFDPVAPGKEKEIDEDYRMIAGMLLTILDNQLFDPPAEFKTNLTTALLSISQKGVANTFSLKKERSGGIEDILNMLGKPQEEAAE